MSGAEIVLGVAGLLGPLMVPPLESAFRHLRKPHYNNRHAREELRGNFIDSWSTLQGSLSRLAPVLGALTHDDSDRRKVLREMEKATKALRKINKGLLECKPIKRALREQEKTEKIVSAVRKKICDGDREGEVEEEEEDRRHSRIDHRKIKDKLGPLIVGRGRHSVSNKSSSSSTPHPPTSPPAPPPFAPLAPTPPSPPHISPSTSTPSISLPSSPSPQRTQAPRALLPPPPLPSLSSSSLHLQIVTKTHHHSRRRHHHRKHKTKSEEDDGYFEDQRSVRSYDTSIRPRDRERERGEGGDRHYHHHHHHYCGGGGKGEAGCSRVLLAGG